MLSLRVFYGISTETAFQLQKERKKKKNKKTQTTEGWMISQALPRAEKQNKA